MKEFRFHLVGDCRQMACALALAILSGCTTVNLEPYRQDLESRHTLTVDASPERTLANAGFKRLASIIDSAGAAHIAGIDTSRQIHHIVVDGQSTSHDEIIGKLAGDKRSDIDRAALDIVEYPAGFLRIVAGEHEYSKPLSGGEWSRAPDNRCRTYLVGPESLFCLLMATGEEAGSPVRTDTDVAIIFIVPLFSRTALQPGKLALAELTNTSWQIRTVIDPDTEFSVVESDYFLAMDRRQVVHCFFKVWKGGSFGMVGASPIGLHMQSIDPIQVRRQAHFPAPAASPGSGQSWQQVRSEALGLSWKLNAEFKASAAPDYPIYSSVSSLARNLDIEPDSGRFVALLQARDFESNKRLGWGVLRQGEDRLELLATQGFPAAEIDSSFFDSGALFKVAQDHAQHLLIRMCPSGFWVSPPCQMVYIRRSADGKIAAVLFETAAEWIKDNARSLALGKDDTVFAAWVSTGEELTGRWLKPGGSHRQ